MSLISVAEAFRVISDSISPSSAVEVRPLGRANGMVLAEDLSADRAYPPYDRCMMDGICFSSADFSEASPPRTFILTGTIQAGDDLQKHSVELKNKSKEPLKNAKPTAWRINTGGELPAGCDCVVPVEELTFRGDHVSVHESFTPVPHKFIHKKGSDVSAAETVLRKGARINSAALSIAASVGAVKVSVVAPPRVFILTTGKEAIPPEDSPTPFQIRRSHGASLQCALQALGIKDITHTHLSDDYEQMHHCLEEALRTHEVIITCGAISKGNSDYLKEIFTTLCGDPAFHGISERPGKPMAYWSPAKDPQRSTPPVFALPGNALSTLVTFHRYTAPALRKMMGHAPLPEVKVSVDQELPDFHLTRFLPVRLLSSTRAELHNPQNSGDFSQLAGTDGFIEIPPCRQTESTFTYYPWL